jgi:hypothetical protein
MSDRARLTISDVIYLGLGIFALAAFWPAVNELIGQHAGAMTSGQQLILTSMLPLAVLVLLSIIYLEARSGLA